MLLLLFYLLQCRVQHLVFHCSFVQVCLIFCGNQQSIYEVATQVFT